MDGHPFTVITADFVPINKWVTTQLTLAIGQRYDVIISANQTIDNYWFRVQPGTGCGSNDILGKGVQVGAILHYVNATDANPTSTTNVTMKTACSDESTSNLVPFVPNQVPRDIVSSAGKLSLNIFTDPTENNLVRWLIDGTPLIVNWDKPTLQTALGGSQQFGNNSNVYSMQEKNKWYLWWIQSTTAIALSHPIHLHGHDFYILGSGTGTWDGSTTGLNFDNPTRRDTATMPAIFGNVGGYLLMAFQADNPGMWVAHCHIAWHASEGLAFQFGEQYSSLKSGVLGDTSGLEQGCREWNGYSIEGSPGMPYNQTDSGI
jgi:FtsP/CotA-like multicopper oxidase with cupredoxin domain